MTKYIKTLAVVGLVIVLVLIGVFVYAQLNDEPTQPNNCEIFSGREYCTNDYVGLNEDEAISRAQSDGLTTRVVASDEDPNILIHDDGTIKRINFSIENNVVVKAEFY